MGNKVSPAVNEMPIIEDSYELMSQDNSRKIWCKQWKPNNKEKARCAIYICHGLGEHCMVYDSFAKMLAQKFDALVFANDHMCHGRSEGEPRAYTESLNTFVMDMQLHVKEVYSKLDRDQGCLPFFIFGHSMGGAISTLFCMNFPQLVTGGVMLMGPLFDLSQASLMLQIKYHASKLFLRVLPLCLPVGGLSYTDCVTEERFVKEFQDDPFRFHGTLKIGLVAALLNGIEEIQSKLSTFTVPLFIGHGTLDRLCCVEASKKFYEGAPSPVKCLKIYEKGAHCLLHEFKSGIRDQLIEDVSSWMTARLETLEKQQTTL